MNIQGPVDLRQGVPPVTRLDLNCSHERIVAPSFLWSVLCPPPPPLPYVWNRLPFLFAVAVLSVALKRRSALRPGGRIRGYNQRRVRAALSERRRRLRDMLADPVLVRDMERRYGDLSSLRGSVEEWEAEGFAVSKKKEDDFFTAGGRVVVPWIQTANVWLWVIAFVASNFHYTPQVMFVLGSSLMHIADNMLLQRAAADQARERSRSERKCAIAAVGVPVSELVPEAEVGVPLRRQATVV